MHEDQLELFEGAAPSAPRPRRESVGRVLLQARYDQLVIAAIVGLIGVTVVFACGVERGKQLARAEAPMSAPATSLVAPPAPAASRDEPRSGSRPAASPAAPKAKPPSKTASSNTRYAIQVVTFSRAQRARQELERLRANGERAFLVMRDGRMSVYVGPFPSKQHASARLASLKSRYQDCFVKSL